MSCNCKQTHKHFVSYFFFLQFPSDVGCFCPFLLNTMTLAPYEALYLPANEPHAYLLGDCVETMATSDNVVRAGLTPKFRDTHTLLQMLSYSYSSAQERLLRPTTTNTTTRTYNPPTREFSVALHTIPSTASSVTLPSLAGPSLFLVVSGAASTAEHALPTASVWFIPAHFSTSLTVTDAPFVAFQSYCAPK